MGWLVVRLMVFFEWWCGASVVWRFEGAEDVVNGDFFSKRKFRNYKKGIELKQTFLDCLLEQLNVFGLLFIEKNF